MLKSRNAESCLLTSEALTADLLFSGLRTLFLVQRFNDSTLQPPSSGYHAFSRHHAFRLASLPRKILRSALRTLATDVG